MRTPAVPLAAVSPPAPAQATPAPRPDRRVGLMGSGLMLFAASCALDVGLTFGLGRDQAALSLVPEIGPLVQLGRS